MQRILPRLFFMLVSVSAFCLPESAIELYRLGAQARARGDYYSAVEYYKGSIEKNADYMEPVVGLAEAYYGLYEYEEALVYAEKAIRLDSGNMEIRNLKGRIYIALGRFEEAQEVFSSVISRQRNNIEASFGLAELDIASGRIRTAEERYLGALKISPDDRKALLALVLINGSRGDVNAASGYLKQALKHHSNNPYVRYTAARHYYAAGEYDEALYHLKTAMFLQPDFLEASLLLCGLYLQDGRYEDAASEAENAIASHRSEYILWYLRGLSLEKSGDKDGAVESYARAFTIKPDEDLSRIALENLIIRETKLDDPVRSIYSMYHEDLGRKYEERNMLDKAMKEYRRSLVINPYSESSRFLYAGLCKRLGYWERYLSMLEMLAGEGGASTDIRDEIEIRRSMMDETVSERWGIDQFAAEKNREKLYLFISCSGIHEGSSGIFAEYMDYLLAEYENMELLGAAESLGFAESFRHARDAGSDYFVMMSVSENERAVGIVYDVYLSSTGGLLYSGSSMKTGNQMLPEACRDAAERISGLFSLSGRIINRRFDDAVVNAGLKDGVVPGDVFLIIRSGGLMRNKDDFGFSYSPEDVLGRFTVADADELVSDGKIGVDQFFDMINPGDYIIREPFPDEGAPDSEGRSGSEKDGREEQEIEQLFIPGELYRSIVNIR